MEAERSDTTYPLGRLVEYHPMSPLFQKHPEVEGALRFIQHLAGPFSP